MFNDYKKLNDAYESSKENFGYYNATGCRSSTYCPDSEEKRRAFDNSCPAGFYCDKAGANRILKVLPKKCPIGFYCPADSNTPIPCPFNRPNSRMMSKNLDNCF